MIYEYQCTHRKCRHITELSRCVADRLEPAFCEKCGTESRKLISIPTRSWSTKVDNEMYPMVNPFLSERGQPPVVFKSASDRKTYYKNNGLIDAVTPEADRPTMYTSDVDCDNYKDFDKFKDLSDPFVENSKYVRATDEWEKNPNE